jgi:intracellular septation protein A
MFYNIVIYLFGLNRMAPAYYGRKEGFTLGLGLQINLKDTMWNKINILFAAWILAFLFVLDQVVLLNTLTLTYGRFMIAIGLISLVLGIVGAAI